jgi:polysaccharide biosynthesis/export protein
MMGFFPRFRRYCAASGPASRRVIAAGGLLCALSAVGCEPIIAPGAKVEATPNAVMALAPYRIQRGDTLEVKFVGTPELNEQAVVRPDGKIAMPYLQDVDVIGLQPAELRDRLVALYKDELRDPELSVFVRNFAADRFYVGGEVNHPGEFHATGKTTVVQALFAAGGTKSSGELESVILIRRGDQGEAKVHVLNIENALNAADPAADVELAPYDVVYVPPDGITQIDRWIDSHIKQIIPYSASATYFINPGSAAAAAVP